MEKDAGGGGGEKEKRQNVRKRRSDEKIWLERVLGMSTANNNAFAANEVTGDVAFIAGATVVVYSPKKNKQRLHLHDKSCESIRYFTCVTFSKDGNWIAAGQRGPKADCLVWSAPPSRKKRAENESSSLEDSGIPVRLQSASVQGGVDCVRFSPNSKLLVAGSKDKLVVWKFSGSGGAPAAMVQLQSRIRSIAFNEAGRYFVIAGDKAVTFFYLDAGGDIPGPSSQLNGFDGQHQLSKATDFLDVVCGRGACAADTYCVTADGTLCCFGQNRLMERWVQLDSSASYAVECTETRVFATCADGTVRVFESKTFEYIATLPKPAALSSKRDGDDDADVKREGKFPSAIAVRNVDKKRVAIIYDDHSLYVWDVRNLSKVGRLRALAHHCGCIWDVAVAPNSAARGTLLHDKDASFVTGSVDGTIRIWSTRALIRTIRIAPQNVSGKGIRCIDVDHTGQFVGAGDLSGHVHMVSLAEDGATTRTVTRNAHDAEVLSLSFSPSADCVATSSRDRLVHVFGSVENLKDVQTLENHSGAVTRVRWNVSGDKLLSCGADRAIVISNRTSPASRQLQRSQSTTVARGTVYDLDVEAGNKFFITASQDKRLNIWSIIGDEKPECLRHYNIHPHDDKRSNRSGASGSCAYRIKLDPSGTLVAACCFDKWIRIFDFYSGECVAQMLGHGELVTSIKWTQDCRRIISVSGDACIFVWRLHPSLTASMRQRLVELSGERGSTKNDDNSTARINNVKRDEAAAKGLFGKMLDEANTTAKRTHRRRVKITDLQNVKGEATLKKAPADESLTIVGVKKPILSENKAESASVSRWSDRLRTGGYDLKGDASNHRYHVSKTSSANKLTLTAELTGGKRDGIDGSKLTARVAAVKSTEKIVAEGDRATPKVSVFGSLEDDDDDEDDNDDDDGDACAAPTSIVYKDTDKDDPRDTKRRFSVTRRADTTRVQMKDVPADAKKESSTPPQKRPPVADDNVIGTSVEDAALRRSLSSEFLATGRKSDVAKSLGSTSDLLAARRSKTQSSTELFEAMKAKLKRRGMVNSETSVDAPRNPSKLVTSSSDEDEEPYGEKSSVSSSRDDVVSPSPSPPTPSRGSVRDISKNGGDGTRSGSEKDSTTMFRESLSNVQSAVQNALEQLRALSSIGNADLIQDATDEFEKVMSLQAAGVHRELGTLRLSMQSFRKSSPRRIDVSDSVPSLPAPSSSSAPLSVSSSALAPNLPELPKGEIASFLDKYSDRLVEAISEKLAKKLDHRSRRGEDPDT